MGGGGAAFYYPLVRPSTTLSAASPVAVDNVRCVGVHVRASTHHEGEHRETAVARAQSRGSATAERRGGCVLGVGRAGACGGGCAGRVVPGSSVGQLSAKEEPVRHACSEEES